VDPAGVIRVLWSDNSGVRLASRINGAWIVERVTTTGCYGARVSVNAAGKMAVACVSSSGTMTVFD
jgi:hypothetical protein